MSKTVLVIGGSFGGLAFAKALHGNTAFDVLIIEKRSYFDMNFASPRLLQDPDLANSIIKEYKDFKWLSGSNVKLVQATVTELHADRAVASDGETYKFDYCVIATGSTSANEFNKSANTDLLAKRLATIKTSAQTVAKTADVLIIGGGLTGIEMAAEAKEAGAEKVALVHSGPFLTGNEAFHKVIEQRLKKIGVDVYLDQRAEFVSSEVGTGLDEGLELGHGGPGQYKIGKATRVFGMVFSCVGFKTVHSAFVGPLGPDVLKANGCLDVNASFQVKGYTNIFAIGDAIDVDEVHLAYLAIEHAAQVAKNIKNLAKKPDAKLPEWKANGGNKMTLLVMGKKNTLLLRGEKTVFTYIPGSMLNMKLSKTKGAVGFPK